MILSRLFSNLNTNIITSIVFVATSGDYLTKLITIPLLKALCDNATHALIGGLCWCSFYMNHERTFKNKLEGLLEILGCTILSSVIDLDHFIVASSLLLKEATSIKNRPFLHCSTIPLMICPTLLLLSYLLESRFLKKGALIILTAFSTHHIRDGARRGLWFYPCGNTPPIPYLLYIILTCLVPYVIVFVDGLFIIEGPKVSNDYVPLMSV